VGPADVSTAQLSHAKKTLDDDLEHLSNSFNQLRGAQAKFRDCIKSIEGGVTAKLAGTLAPPAPIDRAQAPFICPSHLPVPSI